LKKILLIYGHPDETRLTSALMSAYSRGAEEVGYQVSQIVIRELAFEPNLKFGYQQRLELEPDLLAAIDAIKACDHMVWVHPVWWGGLPTFLKGFIDRTFLPSIMFDYNEAKLGGMGWDGYLEGKTARIIATMDTPKILYRLLYSAPSVNQLKKTTLEFCGVKPVKVTQFAPVKGSTQEKRESWINAAHVLGLKGA
jgi:NAD(P)H dehydrogenase (quinone)